MRRPRGVVILLERFRTAIDSSAWHAQAAIHAVVFVVTVTLYGLWAVTGGRPGTPGVPEADAVAFNST